MAVWLQTKCIRAETGTIRAVGGHYEEIKLCKVDFSCVLLSGRRVVESGGNRMASETLSMLVRDPSQWHFMNSSLCTSCTIPD